jgi:hypothetical protein
MVKISLLYVIVAAVVAIIVIGGVAGYSLLNSSAPSPTPSPSTTATPTPSPTATPTPTDEPNGVQPLVRDDAIAYIQDNHPEAEEYITELNWTGGRIETGLIGAEKYVYTTLTSALGSAGWTVTITNPVVLNPIYTLNVNYTQTGVQNPVVISWDGTWQNGTITETSYLSNINDVAPPEQKQVRDDVMNYIKAVHVETSQFMLDLNWTGGKIETGLVGGVQYVYTTTHGQTGGAWWNVEINNAVIPNPTYTVNVNYTETGVQTPNNVTWTGTWQNGTMIQTDYSSNVPATTEQIRDSLMNYIKISHNQTAQFMQNLVWTGGVVDQGLLVGSEKYNYTTMTGAPGAAGWTMELQYPVVLNPTYTISANYTQTGVASPYEVMWTGTWQKGIIVENSYNFVSPTI